MPPQSSPGTCYYSIENNNKCRQTIINVGSVGDPAYGENHPVPHRMETYNAMARYFVLNLEDRITVDQVAVNYDFEAAVGRAEKTKRPDWASCIRIRRSL